MSASAQQNTFSLRFQRRLTELDLLRAVSNITWTADHEESALAAIAAAVLNLPGLTGFRFEPQVEAARNLLHLPIYEASKPRSSGPSASAVSAACANGQTYGQLRIFFDPNSSLKLESPVRLAKFIGQQIGLLLHRIALRREHQRHSAHLAAIERAIRRRKAIRRAAVILATQRNVSEAEATSFMVSYARRNHRTLFEISEALVFGYDSSRVPSSASKVSPFHAR